jgi:hypothetical protein
MTRRYQRPEWCADWDMHPEAIRDLLMHMLLRTVRDAKAVAENKNWKWWMIYRTESQPKRQQMLKEWMDSDRAEFWTEMLDIPIDTAEVVVNGIASGELRPKELYGDD